MLWLVVTAVAVPLVVLGEWRKWTALVWIAKPVASLGFVLYAIKLGGGSSLYGRVILAALMLCLAGDVLLISRSRKTFLAGLGSFLAGHIAFAVAFSIRGIDPHWIAAALLLLTPVAILTRRWLSPHLSGGMAGPVYTYILAIMAMAATAAGTFGTQTDWRILLGAIAFTISDLSVARDRFVHHTILNRAWGLPLYYTAQLLIASSVAP